ncbi:MAG: TldD/PmbA family protein [Candidatus Puniceispirillaceae bacterium]
MTQTNEILIEALLDGAKKAGADQADAALGTGHSTSVSVRLGKTESVERSEDFAAGLRVFVGQKTATISIGQLDEKAIPELTQRAVAMAKASPDDPYAILARPDQIATDLPDLDMYDSTDINTETLTDWALAAEEAARAPAGITNSDGGSSSQSQSHIFIAGTHGFSAGYSRSSFGFSAVVIAEKDGEMQRDYDYSSAVFAEDLKSPEEVGTNAAKRTLARLGAQSAKTGSFPVIFDNRISRSIAGHFASAINGAAIARGTSFLKDKMGEVIASSNITLTDDPLMPRGPGSRAFDGDALPVSRRTLVENGVLQGWLLDLSSAAQLGLAPTGNASRSLAGRPSPGTSNLIMQNGDASLQDLIADIEEGFYVTELIGSSVSLITGDYSRGAGGFWIENGAITFPVSEATIAGNLNDIFKDLTPANDPDMTSSMMVPSLRIGTMMVAGSA